MALTYMKDQQEQQTMSDINTINQDQSLETEQAALEQELADAPDYSIPSMPSELEERLNPFAHADAHADGCGDIRPNLAKPGKLTAPARFRVTFGQGVPNGFAFDAQKLSREAFFAAVQPIIDGEAVVGFTLSLATLFSEYNVPALDGSAMLKASYANGKISFRAIDRETGKPQKRGDAPVIDALDWLRLGYAGVDQRKYLAEARGMTEPTGRKIPSANVNGAPKPETVRSHKPRRGPVN